MFCTQCGFKIEEGFKFCPKCGAQVGAPIQEDMRSEMDRIADEICVMYMNCESPNNNQRAKAIKAFMKKTGVDRKHAIDYIYKSKYGKNLEEMRQEHRDKKEAVKNNLICPRCGSETLETYEEPGITVTRKANVFGGVFISSSAPSSTWMRCRDCGRKWPLKRKK